MGTIAMLVLIIGLIIQLVGAIWFLYVAFNESIPWGLACLLIPFAGLIFLILHWHDAAKPFGVTILGALIVVFASFITPRRVSGGSMVTHWPLGTPAPSFILQDLDGRQVSLSDFRGKVVILDFWATWCPPCVKEIPQFAALYDEYRDQGFAILGISMDQGGISVVESFVQKHRINYPILMADSQVQASYGGIRSIPTTFVIDAEGNMRHKYVGYRDKAVFEADIQPLLAGAGLGAGTSEFNSQSPRSRWTQDRLNESLRQAAVKGDIEQVQLLISQGADVNAEDNSSISYEGAESSWKSISHTALHWAAYRGHKDVVELLIAKGAKIDTTHKDGMTALQLAKVNNHTEVVDLLRKHGALDLAIAQRQGPVPTTGVDTVGRRKTADTLLDKTAPPFTLLDLNRKKVNLAHFKGNVVVLDFWATWCPPCVKEIPHFVELYEEYKDRGCIMLGICVDRGGIGIVQSFAQKYQINYPILLADGRIQRNYGGVTSIPTTFVIDAVGKIRRKYIGYRDKAVFETDIKALLAEAKSDAKQIELPTSQFEGIVDEQSVAESHPIAETEAANITIKAEMAFSARREGNAEIYLMNADGSGQTNVTKNRAHDLRPCWSPDGTQIAFVSNRDGNYEIYVMNSDGTEQRRVTNNSAFDGHPSWSLDGTRIAFVSERDGNYEIYVMNVDGQALERITNNPATDANPCWSPDGKRIAFESNREENSEIHAMDLVRRQQMNLTGHSAWDGNPSWSPDGTKIAYASDRDGNLEIYIMNADGGEQHRLTNNSADDMGPTWSSDGKRIAFCSNRDGNNEIYVMKADGSEQTRVTNHYTTDSNPCWAPLLSSNE